MKTKLLILFFLFFSIHRVYTQNQKAISTKGSINQTLAFKSTILGYDVHYAIYLPPDYALSDKHYPVLFLLHGYTDDHTSWIKQGKINTIMDKGIAKGEIEPMILIIPDGKYFWYINDYQSVARYEDFMFKEFLPFIDKTYKTIPNKEHRAVAGLSMGGYGALVWAMHHPDTFSYCIALSASMFTNEGLINMPDKLYSFMSLLYGAPNAYGNERITEHFLKNSPLHMAENMTSDSLKAVTWFIDCGNEDPLKEVNATLHKLLTKKNIEHIYHARKGKHNWKFWREGIYQGLKYVSEGFRTK
ncbi:MAG: alpha/beta hydrolase-fold protein [Bacteroidales bacterium]|jgi:enterochelin esterase-like enzyme|nr:esterase family protein [Bacteroidales bacterium]MDD3280699.1 alpha/beta hydrolase-fold protein [Bacteroidales bacterium]MDD4209575.1 alpha/beta hydrolase-fold protein [Bacteroidales bacterium]MDY0015024.1 alpha/beta hydrolase-fold protein [Bacteroidales bacterium]